MGEDKGMVLVSNARTRDPVKPLCYSGRLYWKIKMAKSQKDGKHGGGHKPWHGSWLKIDGKCGANGKATGVKEPLNRRTKRFFKRLTGKARRRWNAELLQDELSVHETGKRSGGQWKGKVKMSDDFNAPYEIVKSEENNSDAKN